FHQRRDRGSMTKPGTMIDVIGVKAGAHELLEEVSLLVRGLGGAESGKRAAASRIADVLQSRRGTIERLVPARNAEMRPRIGGIDDIVRFLAHAVLADQWLHQPIRMVDVIEAETPLHTEPILVRRPVPAAYMQELVVFDVVGELAAHAAIGTD